MEYIGLKMPLFWTHFADKVRGMPTWKGDIYISITISVALMEVSSVSPRVSPPGNLGRGWFFCAKSPTLGDKLLSNFPRGGAMGRGSFHAKVKVLVLFIKNGRLPLQLIKKNSFVVVFVTYRYKWLTENSR